LSRKLILSLLSIIISLLSVEVALRLVDPLGMRYFDDLYLLVPHYQIREDGLYSLKPGRYELSNFKMTINAHGDRVVPDTRAGGCQIVAIGDSVVMGWAVDDAETFANLLAREFPDVEFINAGRGGYTIEQVYSSMANYPYADGYLYLINDNDTDSPVDWKYQYERAEFMRWEFAVGRNLMFLKYLRKPHRVVIDMPELNRYLALIQRSPVRLFVLGGELHGRIAGAADIREAYTHVTSVADSHPTAEGQRLIAEQMIPETAELINEVCP
jgi:hypothetical protein